MANLLQLRRGNAAQCDLYTPSQGEPIYDTTNKRIRLGDGSTPGGIPTGSLTDTYNSLLAAAGRYNINTVLYFAAQNRYVVSLKNNNQIDFTSVGVDGTNWKYQDTSIPLATDSVPGLAQLATAAQAQAFTSTNVLSALGLGQAFNGANLSLVGNGYFRLPNSVVIQWGGTGGVSSTSGTVSINFPISFNNFCRAVILTANATQGITATVEGVGPSNFNYSAFSASTTRIAGVGSFFLAIGY